MKIKIAALILILSGYGLPATGLAVGNGAGTDWVDLMHSMQTAGGPTPRECILLSMLGAAVPAECENLGSRPGPDISDSSHAIDWMRLIVNRAQADRLSPLTASRVFAYAAVALYEAARHGDPDQLSLAGQLNGLHALSEPAAGRDYHWPQVVSSAMQHVSKTLFPEISPDTAGAIDDLYLNHSIQARADGVSDQMLEDSAQLGRDLADAVTAWAAQDGFDETRGMPFTPPQCPSCWVPTGGSTNPQPLEPHWGTLRPFVLVDPGECPAPMPAAYSEDPGSDFYTEAMAVYEIGQTLTPEQRLIAHFWADTPGVTGTPPGHWIALLHDLTAGLSLARAAEAYALTAIAMADSFIVAWHEKYRYNLLRPETYIQRHIDPDWQPDIPTPPFPEYVSGHSTSSGSAAEVLTHLFGDGPQTSAVHTARGFKPRAMESFRAGRDEVAVSRLYGGIHFEMGNDAGLVCGVCVGEAVIDRVMTRF